MGVISFRFFNYERARKLGRKRTFAGELIRLRSYPRTHVELQFNAACNYLSFSSTTEDAFHGCRFKLIHYSHPWWDCISREVTPEQLADIWFRAHELNGKRYDLVGLLSFATPWEIIVPRRDRYWCSEAVAEAVKPLYPDIPTEITPEELYKWLRGYNGKAGTTKS